MKYIKFQSGLTLIELLVVIVIIAITATIAIPSLSGVIHNQRDKAIIADITALVETARMAFADTSCENQICKYSNTNNELNFSSSKFSEGTVDFTGGTSSELIKINVDIDPAVFKGRNGDIYKDLIKDGGFTEKQLLDALAK